MTDRWYRLPASRTPEVALLAIGVLLRISMMRSYPVRAGFDFGDHIPYLQWFAHHWSLAPFALCRESYHPPLFYLVAGALLRLGVSLDSLGRIAGVCGCLRLGLLWLGLELHLPRMRTARLAALALAATLPAGLHIDGMATGEGISMLLSTAAIVIAPLAFRARGGARWRWASALAVVLGAALLVKVSALTIVVAVGAIALVELAVSRTGGWRARAARLAPFLAGLGLLGATSGWYFVHNYRTTGKVFVTGFDGEDRRLLSGTDAVPYLRRRAPGFFIGWEPAIFRAPFYPTGTGAQPRFFSVLIASTFADYYNYGLAPPPRASAVGKPPVGAPSVMVNRRPMRAGAYALARLSVIGGTAIALATLLAWLAVLRAACRRRACDEWVLLAVPLVALLGALHFAVFYPLDKEGVIKGHYLQFAAAPLFGLFGLAVERTWRSWRTRPFAVLLLAALALVAAYTLYCRLV